MIKAGTCLSFLREMAQGIHQPGDQYRLAVYGEDAALSPETTAYTSRHEVRGKGYEAGGQVLTGHSVEVVDGRIEIDWNDPPVLDPATIEDAAGSLIYNATRGNRAVVVLDFGELISSANGPFRVLLPNPTVILLTQ